MMAIRARRSAPCSGDTGTPATSAVPEVGRIRVPRTRTVVVFPAPFGPRNPNTSPIPTSKVRSSKARRSPNRLVSERATIEGPGPGPVRRGRGRGGPPPAAARGRAPRADRRAPGRPGSRLSDAFAVPFEVIPSIDLVGSRLGRIQEGRPVRVDSFGGDPVAAARAFVQAGARWIHVVDTDLAFTGDAAGLGVIREISALPVRVQASGGLRTEQEVAAVLAAGASRAVLGSAALEDLDRVADLIASHGERLAVGLEVDGDTVRPRGRATAWWPLAEVLSWLAASWAARVVVTAVARVGERAGPDLAAIRTVAGATGRPLIAAGGIATLEDVRAVAAAAPSVEGAIVGSALYEGGLDLAEALRSMSTEEGP